MKTKLNTFSEYLSKDGMEASAYLIAVTPGRTRKLEESILKFPIFEPTQECFLEAFRAAPTDKPLHLVADAQFLEEMAWDYRKNNKVVHIEKIRGHFTRFGGAAVLEIARVGGKRVPYEL